MDMQHYFDMLLMGVVTIMGFVWKSLHSKVESHGDDLAAFKTHVAENYANNDRINEIKVIAQNTNQRVDDIYMILTKKVK